MPWDDWRVRYAVQILAVFCFPTTVFGQTTGRFLGPTKLFAPASTSSQPIFELSLFVVSIAVVSVVVFFLLAYVVVRFKRRGEDDSREPLQVGSNQDGLAWTVIPVLIVVALLWEQRECSPPVQNAAGRARP